MTVTALLVAGAVIPVVASAAPATPETLWGAAPDATPVVDSDRVPVELGTAFVSETDGVVLGVKFWKTKENTGTHVGNLWGPDGKLLATATFANETRSGWQSVSFSQPVSVKADQRYVVSYHAPNGRYASTVGFTAQSESKVLSVPAGRSGVYSYGKSSTFPTKTWRSSQYWVDTMFVADPSAPGATPTPTPTATSTPTPRPTATTQPRPTPTATSTPTPTPTPKPTSTPTPTPTPTASPTPTTPPEPPAGGVTAQPSIGKGWNLTSSKVGLAPFGLKCADLPEYKQTGNTVPAGTVISRMRITGWLDLSMGNITIKESCIQPKPGAVGMGTTSLTTWNNNRGLQGPITIQDSEYDGSLLSDREKAFIGFFNGVASMYRNYVHDSGSGIGIQGSYEKTGANVVIQNNYVDRLIAYGDANGSGNHQSAFTVRDLDSSTNANRQLLVKDNYFDCDGANATGAFFVQANGDDVRNLTAQGNLLAGMGFNLILEDDQGRFPGVTYYNMRAIDNRMLPTEYGPTKLAGRGEGWAQWTDNYLYSPSGTDGKGKVVAEP
ncbi:MULTISPECIES: DUF4082 domain-containing protein [Microbacterium]|uniref:DUF4082 domain-containing protein n=1 Tax=Microbacterium TaxID=33882 RepID=UPI0013A565CE|nr:DUF4082 domain-containing protein [Microbacterium sp. KCTC 39802]